jgi:hypothetical protein
LRSGIDKRIDLVAVDLNRNVQHGHATKCCALVSL